MGKWVVYHGFEWSEMVEQGWITMECETRGGVWFAFMKHKSCLGIK